MTLPRKSGLSLLKKNTMIIHSFVEASSLAAVLNDGDISRVQLLLCGITIMQGDESQGHLLSANYQVIVNPTRGRELGWDAD
ncbi:unnamed protein product [Microthlaspi erraticum]|uniref:Uncharacterized protein n=1 Tax=Microthlaspi erraticum TaxID=1685480 RepID=A0A6D2HI39_9BRAS|nr:unnamed protein product [Microthlaspi erraticum]